MRRSTVHHQLWCYFHFARFCFFSDFILFSPLVTHLLLSIRPYDMNTKLYLLALAYNLNNLFPSSNQRTSFFCLQKNGNKFSSLCPVLTRRRGSNVVECRSTKGPFSYNNDMCTYDDNAGGYGFVVIEYKHGFHSHSFSFGDTHNIR